MDTGDVIDDTPRDSNCNNWPVGVAVIEFDDSPRPLNVLASASDVVRAASPGGGSVASVDEVDVNVADCGTTELLTIFRRDLVVSLAVVENFCLSMPSSITELDLSANVDDLLPSPCLSDRGRRYNSLSQMTAALLFFLVMLFVVLVVDDSSSSATDELSDRGSMDARCVVMQSLRRVWSAEADRLGGSPADRNGANAAVCGRPGAR